MRRRLCGRLPGEASPRSLTRMVVLKSACLLILSVVLFAAAGCGLLSGGMATVDPPTLQIDDGPPTPPVHSVVGDLTPIWCDCAEAPGSKVECWVQPYTPPQSSNQATESTPPAQGPVRMEWKIDASYRVTPERVTYGLRFNQQSGPVVNLSPRTISLPYVQDKNTYTVTMPDLSLLKVTAGTLDAFPRVAFNTIFSKLRSGKAGSTSPDFTISQREDYSYTFAAAGFGSVTIDLQPDGSYAGALGTQYQHAYFRKGQWFFKVGGKGGSEMANSYMQPPWSVGWNNIFLGLGRYSKDPITAALSYLDECDYYAYYGYWDEYYFYCSHKEEVSALTFLAVMTLAGWRPDPETASWLVEVSDDVRREGQFASPWRAWTGGGLYSYFDKSMLMNGTTGLARPFAIPDNFDPWSTKPSVSDFGTTVSRAGSRETEFFTNPFFDPARAWGHLNPSDFRFLTGIGTSGGTQSTSVLRSWNLTPRVDPGLAWRYDKLDVGAYRSSSGYTSWNFKPSYNPNFEGRYNSFDFSRISRQSNYATNWNLDKPINLNYGFGYRYVPYLGNTGSAATPPSPALPWLSMSQFAPRPRLGGPQLDFRHYDTFFYGGDDWKIGHNLALNLGLTWSYYGQPANLFGTRPSTVEPFRPYIEVGARIGGHFVSGGRQYLFPQSGGYGQGSLTYVQGADGRWYVPQLWMRVDGPPSVVQPFAPFTPPMVFPGLPPIQANTNPSTSAEPESWVLYSGAFDNAYFTSMATGHLYVSGNQPWLGFGWTVGGGANVMSGSAIGPSPIGGSNTLGGSGTNIGGAFVFNATAPGATFVAPPGWEVVSFEKFLNQPLQAAKKSKAGGTKTNEILGPDDLVLHLDADGRVVLSRGPWELATLNAGPPHDWELGTAAWMAAPLPSALPQIKYWLEANGNSSGEAFELHVLDPSGQFKKVVLPDGIVLEPAAKKDPKAQAAGQIAKQAGNMLKQKIAAFCLQYAKLPPEDGMLYRIADPEKQRQYRPIAYVLEAGYELGASGELNPDIPDVEGYIDAIRQYAAWAEQENWDEQQFIEHWIERTRKNVQAMNAAWSKQMEDALRAAAPNRWRDIVKVRQKAKSMMPSESSPER